MTHDVCSLRALHAKNNVAKKLFALMEEKKSNLCVSVDATTQKDFFEIVDAVADYVCVIKTHVDVIEDFDLEFVKKLTQRAEQNKFLIFEDRKFADIGNTVKLQFSKGIYHIADWADITNIHTVSGPGSIQALKEVSDASNRDHGILLLAQMTPEENLITKEYTEKSVEFAKRFPEFVMGFIGNGSDHEQLDKLRLLCGPEFIIMTPGVRIDAKGDGLGQRYATPESAVKAGADVIIVGRGVTAAEDRVRAAKEYQHRAWHEYEKRLS